MVLYGGVLKHIYSCSGARELTGGWAHSIHHIADLEKSHGATEAYIYIRGRSELIAELMVGAVHHDEARRVARRRVARGLALCGDVLVCTDHCACAPFAPAARLVRALRSLFGKLI